MSLRIAITRTLPIAVLMTATMIGGASTARARTERAAIDYPDVLLVVAPSTGLVDDQAVTISAPSGIDGYVLCPTANLTEPDQCHYLGDHTPGHSTDVVHIPARTTIVDDTGSVSVVDCRATSCSLAAVAFGDSGDFRTAILATAMLSFDPAAALRSRPTISVTPNSNLVDAQQVSLSATMSGADLSANDVSAAICVQPLSDLGDISTFFTSCGFEGAADFEGPDGGPFTGTATVAAYINTPTGPVDCRATGATCTMVTIDPVGQVANASLSFTAGAPVKPALLQRPYSPTGPFDPSMISTFDLVGFTPNDTFTVRWCNDAGQCLPTVVASGTLDAHGVASFTGDDFPGDPTGDTTCNSSCSLTATDAHGVTATGGPQVSVVTPVPIGPFHSERLPVSVSPHTGLNEGDTVTVSASGFKPGANLSIVECTNDAATEGIDACDIGTSSFLNGQNLTADAQGRVTATYRISRHISTGSHGDIDCAKGNVDPDAYDKALAEDPSRAVAQQAGYFTCIVVVADIADYSQSGADPIAFAGASFKPLPWTQVPTPSTPPTPPTTTATVAKPTTAKPANPVAAQPTFTG